MAINVKAVVKAFDEAGIAVTADFHALYVRQLAVVSEQAQLSGYRKPKGETLPTAMCFFRHVQRLALSLPAQADAQAEAIAEADAHTNNAGLPTYSALLQSLKDEREFLAKMKGHNGFERGIADQRMAAIDSLLGCGAPASCPACPHGKGFHCKKCWPAARAA